MSLILVVEDDDDIRDYLVLRLERLGHDVVAAADGQSGLELAELRRPDLVVTDWAMPRLTGIELCAALRDQPDAQRPTDPGDHGPQLGDRGRRSAGGRRQRPDAQAVHPGGAGAPGVRAAQPSTRLDRPENR